MRFPMNYMGVDGATERHASMRKLMAVLAGVATVAAMAVTAPMAHAETAEPTAPAPVTHDEKAPMLGAVQFLGDLTGSEVDGAAAKYKNEYFYTVAELDADGNVKTQDSTVGWGTNGTVKVVNQADGSVSFLKPNPDEDPYFFDFIPNDLQTADKKSYLASKEFTYQVTQTPHYPDYPVEGVTMETTTYKFTLTLKNDNDGTMSVWYGDRQLSSSPTGKDASGHYLQPNVSLFTFTNMVKQNPKDIIPASATPAAKVTLTGRDAKAGEFTFDLKDESGKVVDEAKNAADGTVTFKQLGFDKYGTYNYTLSQVPGNAEGVTYDTTEYTVKVIVNAKSGTELAAHVDYAKNGEPVDAATFANAYKQPAQPSQPSEPGKPAQPGKPGNKPQTPANQGKGELSQTGAAVEPVAAALLFMAFAGITLLLVRHKTNR